SSKEFYLGGRKLGPIVTAMSAEASDMSSWLLMGLPGLAYIAGIAEPGWTAIGLAVGTYLNWLIVARRLRNYSVKVKAVTIPSFFSRRFHDNRNVLACIGALVVLIFFIPYTASGFKAIGTLFSSLFDVNYHYAMLFGAVVIIIYTVLGGFLAVANNDLIQSIVMSIALVVIVVFGISQAGGWDAVVANAQSLPGYLNLTQGHNMAEGTASTYGGLSIVSTLAWGLGYFGMPHILLRFMAIEDVKKLKISRRVASIWVVIAMSVAVLIGIIGYGVTQNGGIPFLSTSSESETVIIKMADLLSQFGPLFAIVAGVVLAGIMASTMSTADSQLLTAAAGMSQDLMQDFLGIKMTSKQSLTAARITVAAIAVVAAVLAWNPNSS
ncbi:MAG: sodium/proline symporter, partial [Ruminiclostridium sp.]|nr:sodium/proline symporter [Ruminiclostridium sp.]